MSDPRIPDLLRRGWRHKDWCAGSLATRRDGEGRVVEPLDDGRLLLCFGSGRNTEWVPATDWLPDLSDRATFALALDVLGERVGVVSPDARPLMWRRIDHERVGPFFGVLPGWRLETSALSPSAVSYTFREPVGDEPDPVVALAMALAVTVEETDAKR